MKLYQYYIADPPIASRKLPAEKKAAPFEGQPLLIK
jgi:hypothetical protein